MKWLLAFALFVSLLCNAGMWLEVRSARRRLQAQELEHAQRIGRICDSLAALADEIRHSRVRLEGNMANPSRSFDE